MTLEAKQDAKDIFTAQILSMAHFRGVEHGEADAERGNYNDAPLSGEWSGESIPEILGDLLRHVPVSAHDEVCSEYEDGYAEGNVEV